jgi:hypothetical protein
VVADEVDSDVNVTRETISASDEKKAGAVLAKITQRGEAPRALVELTSACHERDPSMKAIPRSCRWSAPSKRGR